MATTRSNTKKIAPRVPAQVAAEPVAAQSEQAVASEAYKVKPVFDPHSTVLVRNGFHGKLVYKSRRTGERYTWDEFGDEQEMELQELRNAKGSDKAYFAQNWFLFDDPEIVDYLGVSIYYKDALKYDDFDELFELDADAIEQKLSKLSVGQKKSVAYRAAQLIADKAIDSLSKIETIERVLGVALIER